MNIILNGKEFKCHSFAEVKPGEVVVINQCAYLKTNGNQIVGLCSGVLENYGGQPVIHYPDAKLILDPKDD